MRNNHIFIILTCFLFLNFIKTDEIKQIENTLEIKTEQETIQNENLVVPENKIESKLTDNLPNEEPVITESENGIEQEVEIKKEEDLSKEKITQENDEKINEKVEEKISNSSEEISKTQIDPEIENKNEIKIEQKNEIENKNEQKNQQEIEKMTFVEDNSKKGILVPITTANSQNNEDKKVIKFNQEESTENKSNWQTLIMFIISLIFIFGLLILVFLSIYYRIYMFRKRTAPFEVPGFLNSLFPKPVNYEHEITILCSKYMNN